MRHRRDRNAAAWLRASWTWPPELQRHTHPTGPFLLDTGLAAQRTPHVCPLVHACPAVTLLIAVHSWGAQWDHCYWTVQLSDVACGMGCAPLFEATRSFSGGVLAHRASFFYHSPPVPLFAPPQPSTLNQTIWSTFSPCLRLWTVLCTPFTMMARVVVGSVGSDILCR